MARTAEPAALVQARESFYNGTFGEVHVGDVFWNDDPIVKAIPQMFVPVKVRGSRKAEPVVEQATAAPGEKRGR